MTTKQKPELQTMSLTWYCSPTPWPLLHFEGLTKNQVTFILPMPTFEQHAEGSNKEQTIVPHLYVLIHFLKWVKGEDWCLTPSSADTKYTSCVRQTKNSITDYFFNDFWHINPNLSRHNRCNMRLSFCGNKIFCIGYSWASRRSRGKLRSSV